MRLSLRVALALAAGCGTPVPPVPMLDAARVDAAIDSGLDSRLDSGLDGAIDASADAPAARDTGPLALDAPPDDAPTTSDARPDDDAGLALDDGGPCFFPDGGYDSCACDPPGPVCGAGGACPSGLVCVDGACGMRCVAPGAPCGDDGDCPAGGTCSPSGAGSACTRATPGCTDSRECPLGFACESGTCRDRRIGCSRIEGEADCPLGYRCLSSGAGVPFCVRVTRPCGSSSGCRTSSEICRDVDGDGDGECLPMGACDANSDCGAQQTCEFRVIEFVAACGTHGTCRDESQCPTGASCIDLWGDGVQECVEPGGRCARTADCPGRGLCATPLGGGPPTCLERPYG